MKAEKNGHIKQLNAEQRLALRDIQTRILEYRMQAEQMVNQARGLVDQAQAANMELNKAVEMHAKRMNVDLAAHEFDIKKLQFKKKDAPA